MNQITITVPPTFLPVVDQLVQMSQSATREQWVTNVVREVVFRFQLQQEVAAQQQARAQQLSTFWPAPGTPPQWRPLP